MKIYLLDVGDTKYGDCIVVKNDNRSILIDGAHPGDDSLLLAQFKSIFGHDAPFNFALLVVTHCHADHIGCLPSMVANGVVKFERAFVADERLGWGRSDSDDPVTKVQGSRRSVAFALQEEPIVGGTDKEILKLIEDAATLESKYREMLNTLKTSGTSVVRYSGSDLAAKITYIESEFSDFGLKVLGPTEAHLLKCAEAISAMTHDSVDYLSSDSFEDSDIVSMYRKGLTKLDSVDDDNITEDRAGVGAAKNNQSIVLKVSKSSKSALLAGDMQFAVAEVRGLEQDMEQLRAKIVQSGPFDFVKLSHHSSYNGFDLSVWNELITPSDEYVFAHTGGKNDAGHPDTGVLQLLKLYKDQLKFARTDRNGMITVDLSPADLTINVAKGALNNFRRNRASDLAESAVNETATKLSVSGTQAGPNNILQESGNADGLIEFKAKVPENATRVTFTVDFTDEKKNGT